MPSPKTKDQILEKARGLVATEGLGAVSFDAIANQLGISKQAVLYWFPTKRDLLAAMFVPWLEAEAEVAEQSVVNAISRDDAITRYVRSIAAFHCDNLERFRMMYLVPQTLGAGTNAAQNAEMVDQVHPVTGRIYGALAVHLGSGSGARQEAVAIHSAVLGLTLMVGLADALQDPLKHDQSELVEALARRLVGKTES